jgi:hypothetical protein
LSRRLRLAVSDGRPTSTAQLGELVQIVELMLCPALYRFAPAARMPSLRASPGDGLARVREMGRAQ